MSTMLRTVAAMASIPGSNSSGGIAGVGDGPFARAAGKATKATDDAPPSRTARLVVAIGFTPDRCR